MNTTNDILHIVMADDDPDDCLMVKEACDEAGVTIELEFVENGEELLDLLSARCPSDMPTLILLDLNMPKKDGREALREIRRDIRLKYIPVVILTTSKNEDDVTRTYEWGANSFIVKPSSFEELVQIMKDLVHYWTEVVRLPHNGSTNTEVAVQ